MTLPVSQSLAGLCGRGKKELGFLEPKIQSFKKKVCMDSLWRPDLPLGARARATEGSMGASGPRGPARQQLRKTHCIQEVE